MMPKRSTATKMARLVPIGATVSEKLDYVPSSLQVIETARLKYACPNCHAGDRRLDLLRRSDHCEPDHSDDGAQ